MKSLVSAVLTVVFALFVMATPVVAQSESDGVWYEVERLNEGLGVPPNRIDRDTPRSLMESLYRVERTGDWAEAAHLLNLNDIPPGLQAETGAMLAEKLKVLIDRKVVIDWSQLVDRPDGFDASEARDAATAGLNRRSLALWELSLQEVPATIRMDRIKPSDGDPVWVFSSETVSDIDPLFRKYGPSEFERFLPASLKRDTVFGLMLWELIGLPLLIGVALAAGLAVRGAVKAVRSRIDNTVLRGVVRATALPLMIATVTTVIHLAMSTIFVFSGRIDVFLSPLVAVGYVTATLMLVVNTIEAALDRLMGRDRDIDLTSSQYQEQRAIATRLTAARRLLVIIVFFIGSGIVLSTADVFKSLGFSLLASAGALTIVLGFAARKVLGNIISSMQIALNQSARVGDRVVYKGYLCHIERINFTFVQLREWTGTRIIVPVEEFVSESFENWTLKNPEMIRTLEFKLDPSADIDRLRKVFREVIETIDPDALTDPEDAEVKVTGQDVFGIDVWFYVPCADPNTSWDISCEAREKLVARLRDLEADEGLTLLPEAQAAEAA